MEEVLGKVLAQGIEVWWPKEGDRRKGATAGRADERSSSLVDVRRRKEDMTGGSHKEVKYLGVTWADRPPLQNGPSGGRVLQSYPLKEISSRDLSGERNGEVQIANRFHRFIFKRLIFVVKTFIQTLKYLF